MSFNFLETFLSALRILLKEIQRLMNDFNECKVLNIHIMGNEVAHKLARHACSVKNIEMWWDNVPMFVS